MSENTNEQELKAILKKYLKNKASSAERDAVDSWYLTIGSESEDVPPLNDVNEKIKLKKSIISYLMLQIADQQTVWYKTGFVKYAAACLLMMTIGLIGYQYSHYKNHSPERDLVILSGSGTQKQLVLTDGSEVLLNVDSKLIISKDFGDSIRQVELTGEAFFKVAKNKKKPFQIKSGSLQTTVLGTSFNINAYPDMHKVKISVLSGKVQVGASIAGTQKLLAAGMVKNQTLSFYSQTAKYELKNENSELISSWRTNKLYIDNANLDEIGRQLARHYQVKVVCHHKGSVNDKYTIRFNNESMKGVLQILSALTKRKFTYENQQINIK